MKIKDWIKIIVSALLFTSIVAFITSVHLLPVDTENVWIGYYGSILGGIFTLYGVKTTLDNNKIEKETEQRLSVIPIFDVHIIPGASSGHSAIIEKSKNTSNVMFCFQMTNVGIKSARNLKLSMEVNGNTYDQFDSPVLVKEGELWEAKYGVQVLDLNKIQEGTEKEYLINVKWKYKDIMGNKYRQNCEIVLIPQMNKKIKDYNIVIKDIDEAEFYEKYKIKKL